MFLFIYKEARVRFNIIGAGRLGKNLALALMARGGAQLIAVCNRNINSAVAAVNSLNAGIAVESLAALPAVDITFITTPDDCIASVASVAAALRNTSGIVVHCSGVLGSDVLTPLKERGCLIASIHPLRAFRENYLNPNALQDCDCVVEGDEHAVEWLTALFTCLGAQVMPITAMKKNTYHAAAVMASNYLVTLAGCAVDLLIEAGLPEDHAKGMAQRLMQSSLTNLRDTTHVADALTGPLARGDIDTISKHLQAINEPCIDALYRAAGLATLQLTKLDNEALSALRVLLNEH